MGNNNTCRLDEITVDVLTSLAGSINRIACNITDLLNSVGCVSIDRGRSWSEAGPAGQVRVGWVDNLGVVRIGLTQADETLGTGARSSLPGDGPRIGEPWLRHGGSVLVAYPPIRLVVANQRMIRRQANGPLTPGRRASLEVRLSRCHAGKPRRCRSARRQRRRPGLHQADKGCGGAQRRRRFAAMRCGHLRQPIARQAATRDAPGSGASGSMLPDPGAALHRNTRSQGAPGQAAGYSPRLRARSVRRGHASPGRRALINAAWPCQSFTAVPGAAGRRDRRA
jgi:hypothetical protein